ncbi:MAG: ROK family protein [Angelakisella sp.]
MKILALDLGGTMIKAAIVDESGTVSGYRELPSNGKQGGEALLRTAFALADEYNGFDRIGISTAGQVDISIGSIRYANENIPNYIGTPVARLFSNRYHCNTVVENDVNAAALGEAKFGGGRGCPHFICITYGTGIGGGIVINGELFHGADGVAGELGHIVTHPGGLRCGCGQSGCYEQYASTTALVRAATQRNPAITNGRQLFEQLDTMSDLVDVWVGEIALGLVSLIHIFNPHAVVLGGGIMEQPYIGEQLNRVLYPLLMESYRGVRIKTAELGNKAGLIGAAYLAALE